MRRASRKDANHSTIIDDLRKRGVTVADLSTMGGGICDIATDFRQRTVFHEIKCGPKAELKKSQVRFLSLWSGYCGIVRNSEEAIALATDPAKHALTQVQKDKLAAFYIRMDQPRVHLKTILDWIAL